MPDRLIAKACDISNESRLGSTVLAGAAVLIAIVQATGWLFMRPEILLLWRGQSLMSLNTAILVIVAGLGIASVLWCDVTKLSLALGVSLGIVSVTSLMKSVIGIGFSL